MNRLTASVEPSGKSKPMKINGHTVCVLNDTACSTIVAQVIERYADEILYALLRSPNSSEVVTSIQNRLTHND